MDMRKIAIVGCGPGARECVTLAALEEIENAEIVIGSAHLLELFPEVTTECTAVGGYRAEVLRAIRMHVGKRIAVLVTGDPGLASLASAVIEEFGIENCRVLPGISSVQVAFARIGVSWEGAYVVSAHAAVPEIDLTHLAEEKTIAVLTGGTESIQWVAAVARHLGEQWRVIVAQDLTLRSERVFNATPGELEKLAAPLRAVVILRKSKA